MIHWKNFKPFVVGESKLEDLLLDFPEKASFIEIGGFPGLYSIFFRKKFNYDVHLLDYVIIPEIIHGMEQTNQLPEGSIHVLKEDFFTYVPERRFDVVFSYGFIEHFVDIPGVISRHVDLLNENGRLLIVLPNLNGMSGAFFKLTDPGMFSKHNLKSMNLGLLDGICRDLGLMEIDVRYYGKPHLWINSSSPVDSRFMRFCIKYLNGVLQRIPLTSRFFSPLIVVKARK